ncbi:ubiquinone/menaquinone biosynthesis methyltransferase [Cryptobacterium curtum]
MTLEEERPQQSALTEQKATIDTATGKAAPAALSEERVLSIFSEIADQYEQFNHVSSFGQDRKWLERLADLAPINSTSRVLDVAGGTGEVTFTLCRRYHPASILLTDYTPGMLEVAKKRITAGDARSVDVSCQVVDAQDMPFADASFDVVTMAYGIRNMPDRLRALREIHRVLVPGGTAVILEFSQPTRPIERAFYRAYLKWGIPAWGQHFTGKRDDFVYLAQSIKAFPDCETFADMLHGAGFSQVTYERVAFGAAALHTAVK